MSLPVSVEALARQADAVIQARVEGRESRWSDDRRHIYTLVTLRTLGTWKGAPPDRLVVRVPGGEVGDIGQRVDAAATFDQDEQVVVFLTRDGAGAWRVHGMGLGKFHVEAGQASPSLAGITFAKGSPPAGERIVETMPVDELERRVKAAR